MYFLNCTLALNSPLFVDLSHCIGNSLQEIWLFSTVETIEKSIKNFRKSIFDD